MAKIKNKVLNAGIWYTISNFIVKGLGFITLPIFTRIMSQSDVGSFSNILSWFSMLSIVTTFEIYSSVSVARFDYKKDLDSYVSSSLFLGTIITSFFYLIVLIFHRFFENLFMMSFDVINIMFIYLLVYPAVQMLQIKSRIEYKYKLSVFISLFSAFISTFISILGVLLFKNSLYGRIYGYFIPLIIIAVIIYIYLIKKGKSLSRKYWNYALAISFPLIWHLLAGYILTSADRIMITKIISPEANALYSVSYTISMVVSILWQSMNQAWSPWAYEKMDNKEYDSLKRYSKPYLLFFITIVYIIMLIVPEVLLIAAGKNYVSGKFVIPPVMVGYIFQFIYSFYVNIEFYHKKQKQIAIGTIIAALINIILNYIFIPIFGYIAAAYTTLIGYVALYFIHYMFVKKLGYSKWYDTGFFIKIVIISLMYMILCNYLYNLFIIRYLLSSLIFIIILVICIVNREKIKKYIKSFKNGGEKSEN